MNMSKGSGSIVRLPDYSSFTIMSNRFLRDERLSSKARGVMATMLSFPDNWDYSIMGLTKIMPDGKASISSSIAELEKYGYLTREQEHGERGKFGRMIYTVIPEPLTENQPTVKKTRKSPLTDFPSTDKPPAGKPLPENQPQLNTNKLNTNKYIEGGRSVGRTTRTREMIQQQINYSDITKSYLDKALIDSIVDIMLDTYKHCKEKITLGNREYDREEVFATLDAITQDEVLSIKEFVSHYTKQIHNPYNFILTLLLQAKEGQDAYWQALVAFDAVGKV